MANWRGWWRASLRLSALAILLMGSSGCALGTAALGAAAGAGAIWNLQKGAEHRATTDAEAER